MSFRWQIVTLRHLSAKKDIYPKEGSISFGCLIQRVNVSKENDAKLILLHILQRPKPQVSFTLMRTKLKRNPKFQVLHVLNKDKQKKGWAYPSLLAFQIEQRYPYYSLGLIWMSLIFLFWSVFYFAIFSFWLIFLLFSLISMIISLRHRILIYQDNSLYELICIFIFTMALLIAPFARFSLLWELSIWRFIWLRSFFCTTSLKGVRVWYVRYILLQTPSLCEILIWCLWLFINFTTFVTYSLT